LRLGSRFEKAFKGAIATIASQLSPAPSSGPFRFNPGLSILILRPDRLGDFILTTPALAELEKLSGGSQGWTIVAGTSNAQAARFFFPKAKVLLFERSLISRCFLFWKLFRNHFDLTIDFHSFPFSATSAFLALLSGSPFRVGFHAQGDNEELSHRVFNLGVPQPNPYQHESEKSWSLLGPLVGGVAPRIHAPQTPALPAETESRVEAFFKSVGGADKNFRVGLHPTLLKEDNRWSLNRYLELIERLSRLNGIQVFLVHGKGEEGQLRDLLERMGPRSHVFTLPENDLLFILGAAKRFDLFVCNDSGLMHWGALVTPVIALFGPSDPRQWAPLTEEKTRLQIFSSNDKLCDSIEPLEVAQEIERRMAASRR
jgi:ADP-heptose:LPS heptosyltransferase